MIFINRSEKQRQRIQWPESAKYIPTASPPTRIDNKRKIKTSSDHNEERCRLWGKVQGKCRGCVIRLQCIRLRRLNTFTDTMQHSRSCTLCF